MEPSITGRVETQRNDFFYLLSFAGFPNLFWLIKKLLWCFLIFLIFCYFCRIFNYGSGRNTTERFFAFSLFRSLSQPILARNEAMMVFSKFLNFYAIFLELSITGLVEAQQDDFFHLLSFAGFPNLFWLVKKLRWCFLIF